MRRRTSQSGSRQGSRGRSRSRRRSRSGDRRRTASSDALRTQIERMAEKLRYMEGKKRWNSRANEKQYLHEIEVKQLLVEDVRKHLEDHFGSKESVQGKIEDAIK